MGRGSLVSQLGTDEPREGPRGLDAYRAPSVLRGIFFSVGSPLPRAVARSRLGSPIPRPVGARPQRGQVVRAIEGLDAEHRASRDFEGVDHRDPRPRVGEAHPRERDRLDSEEVRDQYRVGALVGEDEDPLAVRGEVPDTMA